MCVVSVCACVCVSVWSNSCIGLRTFAAESAVFGGKFSVVVKLLVVRRQVNINTNVLVICPQSNCKQSPVSYDDQCRIKILEALTH